MKQKLIYSILYIFIVAIATMLAFVMVHSYAENEVISPSISCLGPGLILYFIIKHSIYGFIPLFLGVVLGTGATLYFSLFTRRWYLKLATAIGVVIWWLSGYFTYSITFFG